MKLFEVLINWVIHHYKYRGKNTLIMLIKWISPYELFVRSAYGVYIKEDYGDVTWRACCFGYKKSVIPELLNNIPEDGCFIDIGANIGIFSLLASKRLGVGGIVISFEVNPTTYYKLVRNIEKNDPVCIMLPMNVGLSDETMIARVSFDLNHSGTSHVVDNQETGSPVVTSSWDDVRFLENVINGRDTYIKIDVEGMELKVIKAVENFLRNSCVKMIALEIDEANMNRYGSTPQQLYDVLLGAGFVPTINVRTGLYEGHYDEIFVREGGELNTL